MFQLYIEQNFLAAWLQSKPHAKGKYWGKKKKKSHVFLLDLPVFGFLCGGAR